MQSDLTFLHANLSHFHSPLSLLYSSFPLLSSLLPHLSCQGVDLLLKSPHTEGVEVTLFCLMYIHVGMCTYECMCCVFMHACVCYAYILWICMCVYVHVFMHVVWKEIALWDSTWLELAFSFCLFIFVEPIRTLDGFITSYFTLIFPGWKWDQVPACSSEC